MNRRSYWPSPWPVECGGNHRPKATPGPGLDLLPTDQLVASTRHTGGWPVMFVQRDPGQLFLYGTSTSTDTEASGWVERVDPITLEPISSSGPLPAGGHEWCGSIAVHRNGYLYVVSGSHLHRLDADCRVRAERPLPVDHAHNGLQILSDGSVATKDIRLGPEPSTLTVCGPDLEVLDSIELPEPSMGRIASTFDGDADGEGEGDVLYVPGATSLHRVRWDGSALELDRAWSPPYRFDGAGGLAWDPTIADGYVWLMDNGSIGAVERRFSQVPPARTADQDGSGPVGPGAVDWTEPVRLIAASRADAGEVHEIVPFADQEGGWVVAPPLVHDGVALVWDTANTGLTALDIVDPSTPVQLWRQPFRVSMQPLLFADTGEVVVNDFRVLTNTEGDAPTSDDLVVLDLRTGMMKGRIATGASRMNGMFLTPGWNRDIYYCTFGTVARIHVQEG